MRFHVCFPPGGMRLCALIALIFCLSPAEELRLLHGQEEALEAVEIADGQEVQEVQGGAVLIGLAGQDVGKILGAKQFQLQQIFKIEIQKINEACQLDKTQLQKLQIGAKGTVKKLVEKFKKEGGRNFLGGVNLNSNEVVEMVEIKDVSDIESHIWQSIDMGDSPTEMFKYKKPTDELLWLNTVKGTLSEDQFSKYESDQAAKRKELRKATIELGLNQFRLELNLTDKQAADLGKLIETKAAKLEDIAPLYSSFLFLFSCALVENEQLKDVLDDSQYQRLQITMAPIKPMIEMLGQELDQ